MARRWRVGQMLLLEDLMLTPTLPARVLVAFATLMIVPLVTMGIAPQARSASIVNGDFETGDFTGWSIETDGSLGVAPDFTVVSSGGGYAARVEADYYAIQGDVTSTPQDVVFIANTLHQPLELSALPGEKIRLSFDWAFGGEDGGPSAGDVLLIGLTDSMGQMHGMDGLPGYIQAPIRSYGSGTFSAVLDPGVFNNASGWSLEIQLLVGVDPSGKQHNALGSYVETDNINVPEPGVLSGLGAGCVLLFGLHRRRSRPVGRSRPDASKATRRRVVSVALPLGLLLGLAHVGTARAWTDISGSAALTANPKALDRAAGVLFSYAEVTNQSGGPLQTLRLVVTTPSIAVANPDGFTGAVEPFFDLPPLADGESASVRVEFPLARAHLDYGLRLEELPSGGPALAVTTAPSLTMDPNGLTPLAGLITATTNIPARVTMTVTSTSHSFEVEFHEHTIDHALQLLGLRADTSYTVDLTFTDPDDNSVVAGSLMAVTAVLPAAVPDITVMVNLPIQKEPGYTWLDQGAGGYAFVFDEDAEVVWYSTHGPSATIQLENGDLFSRTGTDTAEVVDMLGNIVSETIMQIAVLPESTLHHELFPTVHGTFISLERENVMVDDYPTSITDPNAPTATKQLIDEPAVEFLPDGTALKRWSLVDAIDPTRIYWDSENPEPIDWAHPNAIVHDPRDDSLLISVRHQSCVVKLDRVTGELKWILGNPSNWTPAFDAFRLQPVGTLDWQYYQHAVMVAPNGNLMLFDNGNWRSSPFDPWPQIPAEDSESRAVEFAVDEANMEVTQVWEWSPDFADRIFSRFISDADALPQTGNVLINFGGTSHMGGISTLDLGYENNVVRLIEVTHAMPGQVVMDILVSDPFNRVTAYRAEHWASLYPPNATQSPLGGGGAGAGVGAQSSVPVESGTSGTASLGDSADSSEAPRVRGRSGATEAGLDLQRSRKRRPGRR